MKTVIVNKFDGGHAEDVRTTNQGESTSSQNFDIQTNPHRLFPMRDMAAETMTSGTLTDYDITDVIACDVSGTTQIIGWGRQDGSNTNPTFFMKSSSSNIASSWDSKVSGGATDKIQNTLVEYKKFAYALETIATPNLVKYTPAATYTTIGTLAGYAYASPSSVPKPFVHPEDNMLYIGFANAIFRYDGSATTYITAAAFTIPTHMMITSLTNYGGYLAISAKPLSGVGASVVYLWGRDVTLTTAQGIINWGDTALEIIENVNEVLIGVSQTKNIGSFTSNNVSKFAVSYYNGANVVTIKEYVRDSGFVLRNFKAKRNNKLYFGFDTDNAIWSCGKNKEGRYFVAQDTFITPTGSSITGVLNGISLVGDYFFIAYTDGGVGVYLARTTTTFANTSVYLTSINPNMPEGDRYLDKKLMRVEVAYELNSSNGTCGLGYYNEDFSGTKAGTLQTAISETKTASGQYVASADAHTDGTPFLQGKEYTFRPTSVGDVRIKEIRYYYDLVA